MSPRLYADYQLIDREVVRVEVLKIVVHSSNAPTLGLSPIGLILYHGEIIPVPVDNLKNISTHIW